VSKSVRIGVAGAGAFGAHHAAKYADHEKAVLTAVYDIDAGRAGALAHKHGASAINDVDALLGAVDALVIAAPASRHYDLAKRALTAGCHVFVEKPLALTLKEADALIAAASARSLVLQVGHQERYVFEAAGLMRRKSSPLRIECRRCAPPTGRGLDVSAVFDLMVHDLDLVRQLTASDVAHIAAEGDGDTVQAELVLENGAVAVLRVDRNARVLERSMELVYEDGVIQVDFVNRKFSNSTPTALSTTFDAADAPLAFRDPLAFGADRFLTAIVYGVDPIVTGPHGRAAIEWALMIEQAQSTVAIADAQARQRLRA